MIIIIKFGVCCMGLYVFYGEEDFLREYNSNKVIQDCNLSNFDMNFIKLNEEKT